MTSKKTAKKTAKKTVKKPEVKKVGGEDKKTSKKVSVAHVFRGGEVIRSYSAEDHGENFVDLAKEFAGKEEGRSVETE